MRLVLVLLLVLSGAPALAATSILGTNADGLPSLAPIVKRVTPGVVNIAVRGSVAAQRSPLLDDPVFRQFFGLQEQQPARRQFQATGSGVILDAARGLVITNHHVVENAQQIAVTLRDGRELEAKLIGADTETDIALLQVPARSLAAVPIGDSDRLEVGDFVIAIGNPFGLGQTVTSGMVSALSRSGLGIEGYEDFIQTDASINPGNSGGALVNLRGELIGINTAILGPSGGNIGIGFAIPINLVRGVVEDLQRYGEVRRGALGISAQDVTQDIANALGLELPRGALIASVAQGGPAFAAGLRRGDVVVALNGQPINSAGDLRNRLGLLRIGTPVKIDYLRGGNRRTAEATLVGRAPIPKRRG